MNGNVLRAIPLGVLYFGLAAVTIGSSRFDGGFACVWLANAPLLACLLGLSFRNWVAPVGACLLASVVATATIGFGLKAVPLLPIVNIGEPVLCAFLLQRYAGGFSCLASVRGVGLFLLFCGVVAPVASGAPAAVVALWLTDVSFSNNLLRWTTSHGLGMIAFAPILMLTRRGGRHARTRPAASRSAAWTALWVGMLLFADLLTFSQQRYPLLFLPMLPMIAATIMGGRFGASASVLLLVVIGGTASVLAHGPVTMIHGDIASRILFFQFYVGCATALILLVSGLLKQYRRSLTSLAESEAKYRVIADCGADAVLEIGREGSIHYASRATRDLTGREPGELVGLQVTALVHSNDRDAFVAICKRALAEADASHSAQFRVPERGVARWFEATMRAVVSKGRSVGLIASMRDISDRKAIERELSLAAMTDPLTGLANRRAFMERLELFARSEPARPASIAIFDLDSFKAINDNHGHAAGDAVLRSFADVARRTFRASDCVARIGGEEFAVLLTGADLDQAAAVCNRQRTEFAHTAVEQTGGVVLMATVSVGVALLKGRTGEQAMHDADMALYQAKSDGRDRLRFAA